MYDVNVLTDQFSFYGKGNPRLLFKGIVILGRKNCLFKLINVTTVHTVGYGKVTDISSYLLYQLANAVLGSQN